MPYFVAVQVRTNSGAWKPGVIPLVSMDYDKTGPTATATMFDYSRDARALFAPSLLARTMDSNPSVASQAIKVLNDACADYMSRLEYADTKLPVSIDNAYGFLSTMCEQTFSADPSLFKEVPQGQDQQ